YIPWWQKPSQDVELTIRAGFSQMEQAYDVITRANDGEPPSVSAGADGGFAQNFRPLLKFLPAAPAGFQWEYGAHPSDGSMWAGLNYFCLKSTTVGAADVVAWKGASRAASVFSPEQYMMNSECGAITSVATPANLPSQLSITFYVSYVPGVTK
ncbi:hypothetical protein LC612_37380, partial [Nostoc sp. CHAB 5834]|nr:hypothetical protein [Nostoc sp. CHAB 5834]